MVVVRVVPGADGGTPTSEAEDAAQDCCWPQVGFSMEMGASTGAMTFSVSISSQAVASRMAAKSISG